MVPAGAPPRGAPAPATPGLTPAAALEPPAAPPPLGPVPDFPALDVPGVRGDGPVLVLAAPDVPADAAICAAVLPTEGFADCAWTDPSQLGPGLPLGGYRAIVVGAGVSLRPAQVGRLAGWVRAGGTLIAFRPPDGLGPLLGLAPRTGVLADGYLAIDTGRSPGAGLTGQSLQFHGDADLRAPAGARSVAALYRDARTPTRFPAVSERRYGAGLAAGYAFDPVGSILLTRNGDPARSGAVTVSSDGVPRLADRFGAGFLDLSRAAVPQADELMHLLTHELEAATGLPRLWYLPSADPAVDGGLRRAALVLTGDDHAAGSQTVQRFARLAAAGPAGCRPQEWTCPRATSYAYPGAFGDDAVRPYLDQGFELEPHPSQDGRCATGPVTTRELTELAEQDEDRFAEAYPSTPAGPPLTLRWHCYGVWHSYAGLPVADDAIGVGADTSSACWPQAAFDVGQCLLTGTALPMPYAGADGRLVGTLELTTQVTDENPATAAPAALERLLADAVGPAGYYGYYTVLAHLDGLPVSNALERTVLALARRYRVPVISAAQATQFWLARQHTRVESVRYRPDGTDFTLAEPAHDLELLIPAVRSGRTLRSLSRDGHRLPLPERTLDGVRYALVAAASAGRYRASYG